MISWRIKARMRGTSFWPDTTDSITHCSRFLEKKLSLVRRREEAWGSKKKRKRRKKKGEKRKEKKETT
jgi:hypothetical protein